MTDFAAQRFSLDSTLELVADHWEAVTPDSTLFRAASPADRVTLAAGLLDSSGNPVTISTIIGGVIDEYELTITPKSISGVVRGRDPAAFILDTYVEVGFARPMINPNLLEGAFVALNPTARFSSGAGAVFSEVLPGFDPTQTIAEPRNAGRTKASVIAAKLVAVAGLSLQWEVRDYEIANTFQASGRIVDILRKLIEPWTLVEPFKADIFLQGGTVIIRHRQLPALIPFPQAPPALLTGPGGRAIVSSTPAFNPSGIGAAEIAPLQPSPAQPLTASAENTLTIAATRRSQLTVRKRRFKKIGKVILHGRKVPLFQNIESTTADNNDGGGGGGGTETVEYVNEAFDVTGALTQRTVMEDTFRMPDRILLRSTKSTFTLGGSGPLILSARETIVNSWEPSLYDQTGPITTPKQLSQATTREITDADAGTFRVDAIEQLTYAYDEVGFLTGETTVKRQFDSTSGLLQLNSMIVKTTHDVGPLITEQIVETYSFNTDKQQWTIASRTSTLGGGHRPGGPGRGLGKSGIAKGGGGAAFTEIFLVQTFSTDPDAIPVEYSNENLQQSDLQFIMSQFAATVGLFEYELIFEGVAIPWLRRGTAFNFVGLISEDGVTPIPLPTVLVTEVNSNFDESKPQSSYTMRARAFGWATF